MLFLFWSSIMKSTGYIFAKLKSFFMRHGLISALNSIGKSLVSFLRPMIYIPFCSAFSTAKISKTMINIFEVFIIKCFSTLFAKWKFYDSLQYYECLCIDFQYLKMMSYHIHPISKWLVDVFCWRIMLWITNDSMQ